MRRLCLVGSGSVGLRDLHVCKRILELVPTGKPAPEVVVLYVGTAAYDKEANKTVQTMQFVAQGCKVLELKISAAETRPLDEFRTEVATMCEQADIILG
jgi:hypothetical protein